MKMAKAMGVEKPASGKDFIKSLGHLLAAVDCPDLKMSEAGIIREDLRLYLKRIHEVPGGDITTDPLPLSDEDYMEIVENAYR